MMDAGASKFALSLPKRSRIEKDTAEEVFASLASARYEAVEITGHCVTPDAATVAASALTTLAKKQCMRRFAIPDCIAGLDNNDAVAVLSSLCDAVGKNWNGLHVVDLSSNALGSRGVTACNAVLGDQPQLRELYLSNNGLAVSSTKLLRMSLCPQPSSKTNLRVFQCTLNCIESDGLREIIEIVKCSPQLEHLRLSSLRAQSDSTVELFNTLAETTRLRILDVSDNGVNEEGVTALANALDQQKNLEALIIRDLALELDQIEEIVEPLLRNQVPLDTLDLSGNEVTNEGCPLIHRILSTLPTLRCFKVADAELSNVGIEGIAKIIENSEPLALRSLSVASNRVRDYQALALATAVLKLSHSFKELDLDDNYVTDSTLDAIRKHLGDAVSGKMQPEDEWDEPEDEDEEHSEDDIAAAIEALNSAAMERPPAEAMAEPQMNGKSSDLKTSGIGTCNTPDATTVKDVEVTP